MKRFIIYLTLFTIPEKGSNTAFMYFPDMTDVPTINIQSSNIQYFSRTRKYNLTTLFCKVHIVCAIYVWLVHVQNEMQWYSIHKYSSPIYNKTIHPRPQDIYR